MTVRVSDWIAALRSGDYVQGKSRLKSQTDKYCCLGVLCEVAKLPSRTDGRHTYYIFDNGLTEDDCGIQGSLEQRVNDLVSNPAAAEGSSVVGWCITMNDYENYHQDFNGIADWLEENAYDVDAILVD